MRFEIVGLIDFVDSAEDYLRLRVRGCGCGISRASRRRMCWEAFGVKRCRHLVEVHPSRRIASRKERERACPMGFSVGA